MLVQEYNAFVVKTDQYKDRPAEERRAIALYGLVGEIGSLLAAVKKISYSPKVAPPPGTRPMTKSSKNSATSSGIAFR